jgi:hypothetical protein
MKRRTSAPVSVVIETEDEARVRIASLPEGEREAAERALQEAEGDQRDVQDKYNREQY